MIHPSIFVCLNQKINITQTLFIYFLITIKLQEKQIKRWIQYWALVIILFLGVSLTYLALYSVLNQQASLDNWCTFMSSVTSIDVCWCWELAFCGSSIG